MKALPAIAAGMLAAFLALAPLISPVAAATVTVSISPTSATSGTQMTITGTVSPAPGAGTNAFISVANPANTVVVPASVLVDATTGAFSYSFGAGGTSQWTTGTYTVTVTASGATGTTAFSYSAPTPVQPTAAAVTAVNVQVTAESPVWPGQTFYVSALTSYASNGSLVEATFQTIHYHTPAGGLVTLCTNTVTTNCVGTFTRVHIGFYVWSIVLPGDAPDGGYFIHGWVNNGPGVQGQGLGEFTVNSGIAQQGTLTSVSTAVGSVSSAVTSMANTISGLGTTLSALQSAATATQKAANDAAAAAAALSGSVNTIVTGVQNSQTYVLVVAALAAITLVLELAILVRKLS